MNYTRYDGMHAIEMFNGSSIQMGHDDFNPRVYDDILNTGKRIFGVAGDENHNEKPDDSRYSDSNLAWTMIKSEELEYGQIATALLNGDMYASNGPEIYDLYVEDGKVHITCSPGNASVYMRSFRDPGHWDAHYRWSRDFCRFRRRASRHR